MTRKATHLLLAVVVTLLIGAYMMPAQALSSMGSHSKVRGQVVVINVTDTPNVIVIRTTTANNQELIVGAIVDPEVDISQGKRRVSLRSLKGGEFVDLVYVKTLEGLVAQSIHVR